MYLVSECTTKSAPSCSGRVAMGVAKVESTASSTPWRRAMSATAAMSVRAQNRIGRRFDPDHSGGWLKRRLYARQVASIYDGGCHAAARPM